MGNLRSRGVRDPDMGDSIFVSSALPPIRATTDSGNPKKFLEDGTDVMVLADDADDQQIDFESDPRTIRERITLVRSVRDFPLVYRTLQALGEGITGKVFKVVDVHQQERAMKRTYGYNRPDKPQVRELQGEIKLLRMLDHPNLLRFVEHFEDPPDSADVRLIIEMCKGGSLASASGKARLLASDYEDRLAYVVYQLLLAVKFIHDRGIAHRDIKLDNVMFVSSDPNSLFVQLIDFGLAAWRDKNVVRRSTTPSRRLKINSADDVVSVRRLKTFCGTLPYMSPEVLKQSYDYHGDLWSLGVLVFELITGGLPFQGESEQRLVKQIRKGRVDYSSPSWSRLSPSALELVQHLLVPRPHDRWSAASALRSPWFFHCKREIERTETDVETTLVEKGFQRYASYNPFRKLAMQVIAHFMEPPSVQLEMLHRCFMALDVNQDGVITEDELRDVFEVHHDRRGPPGLLLFEDLDFDGNGELTWTNFIAVGMEAAIGAMDDDDQRFSRAFDYLAQERHTLKVSRLVNLLGEKYSGDGIWKQMATKADRDADGYLDKTEFLSLLRVSEGDKDVFHDSSSPTFNDSVGIHESAP